MKKTIITNANGVKMTIIASEAYSEGDLTVHVSEPEAPAASPVPATTRFRDRFSGRKATSGSGNVYVAGNRIHYK